MIIHATRRDMSRQMKMHQLIINAYHEQRINNERALDQIIHTEHRVETDSLCDLECNMQNLLVGLGCNFLPSDTMLLNRWSQVATIIQRAT